MLDALSPEYDSAGDTARSLRCSSFAFGHLFYHSWQRNFDDIPCWVKKLEGTFRTLVQLVLPDSVAVSAPEGYAYYGLYPETYLMAAAKYFAEMRPRKAVCIGVRSIGTSLSAVVGATLRELGVKVCSYTVRPRGHPFERKLRLAAELEETWRLLGGADFLIVDEGPGLSGSSLACVAQKLSELGVPDDRIILFPSWTPDGSQFLSAAARDRWRKHRKYTASFQKTWIDSGRFTASLPDGELHDLSGGQWRALFYRSEREYPAVQPQHERQKYLWRPAASAQAFWLKFAGLGRYGAAKLARAEELAAAGFGPRPLGLVHGF